jgi:hypothetical protein
VAGAGWSLVAQIRIDGQVIAGIDVVVRRRMQEALDQVGGVQAGRDVSRDIRADL